MEVKGIEGLMNRNWFSPKAASPDALVRLREVSPIELPEAYYALLSETNGGEGPLGCSPFRCVLDSAEDVIDTIISGRYKEFFPGFIIIGSNGSGEFIAFDSRNLAKLPVVAIDMTNINLDESVDLIATDFDTFLEFVGIEPKI